MATVYKARTEYKPRTENEALGIDPQTGHIYAVQKEPMPDTVFIPIVLAVCLVAAVVVVALVFIAVYWDLLVNFSHMPGRG